MQEDSMDSGEESIDSIPRANAVLLASTSKTSIYEIMSSCLTKPASRPVVSVRQSTEDGAVTSLARSGKLKENEICLPGENCPVQLRKLACTDGTGRANVRAHLANSPKSSLRGDGQI